MVPIRVEIQTGGGGRVSTGTPGAGPLPQSSSCGVGGTAPASCSGPRTGPDHPGWNNNKILIQWQEITKNIDADILVLDMKLLDKRQKNCGLARTLIPDMVLQAMAYFAQTERESIHQRQAEGIAAARARGQKLGRKPLPEPESFEEIYVRCRSGEMTMREAAKTLQMSPSTFWRRFVTWVQI